jgi:hypothetical protein
LALLQAEATACGEVLTNGPNVQWLFIIWFLFFCLYEANCQSASVSFAFGGNVIV